MPVELKLDNQAPLPIHRLVGLCATGIRHRLFRSSITLSIVVLAIAFLVNTLTEAVVAQSVRRGLAEVGVESRVYSRFVAFFQPTDDVSGIMARLRLADDGSWEADVLRTWLGLDAAELEALRSAALEAETHLQWLGGLNMAHRRMLLERRRGRDALLWLAEPDGRAHAERVLAETPQIAAPQGLLGFAPRYPELEDRLAVLATQFDARAAALSADLWSAQTTAQLNRGGNEGRAAIEARLRAHGLILREPMLERLVAAAADAGRQGSLIRALERPEIAAAWRHRFNEVATPIEMLTQLASSRSRCEWLAEAWRGDEPPPRPEEIQRVAMQATQTREVVGLEAQLTANYGDRGAINPRVVWLIVVSFLVCLVGIANAMLVSVLERFREIATMKCIGALDTSIALLFLMEAAILGVVGGGIGLALGLLVGVGRMAMGFGQWTFYGFDWAGVLTASAVSLILAVLLTTMAAMYPAWKASRLPPMEAMRLE